MTLLDKQGDNGVCLQSSCSNALLQLLLTVGYWDQLPKQRPV